MSSELYHHGILGQKWVKRKANDIRTATATARARKWLKNTVFVVRE